MVKARRVPVRSFGSEVEVPSVEELGAWIRQQVGSSADLTTYLLDSSLRVQFGVDLPCAGGICYGDRWVGSIRGIQDRVLVHDPDPVTADVESDAALLTAVRKGIWVGIPAPHRLNLLDEYFRDPEECCAAICGAYRTLMRAMRDRGIGGHVILAEAPDACELEILAGSRAYYFLRNPDVRELTAILEYQPRIAVSPSLLGDAAALQDEFRIRSFALLDPSPEDLRAAADLMDPGRIETGGYCTMSCGEYWEDLVERSLIPGTLPPRQAGGSGGSPPAGGTGSGPTG